MDQFKSAGTSLIPEFVRGLRSHIERTIRGAIPALADFCLVHLIAGRSLECVAAVHTTPQGHRLVRALARIYRIRSSDVHSSVAHVVRTQQPLLRTAIAQEVAFASPREGRVADLHRQLAPRSALVVPLVHDGQLLGTLSLCYAGSGRSYAQRDVATARAVASRISQAIVVPQRPDGLLGLRSTARHARQGTTVRRRVAARG